MTNASKKFLEDYAAGKRSAVPDSVWQGNDCWLITVSGQGWNFSERGKKELQRIANLDTK